MNNKPVLSETLGNRFKSEGICVISRILPPSSLSNAAEREKERESNGEYGRDWITWRDSPSRAYATPWRLRPLSGPPASYGGKDERPQQEQEATAESSHAQYRSDSSRSSPEAS